MRDKVACDRVGLLPLLTLIFFVDHGKDEENVWPNPVCGAQEPDDG